MQNILSKGIKNWDYIINTEPKRSTRNSTGDVHNLRAEENFINHHNCMY